MNRTLTMDRTLSGTSIPSDSVNDSPRSIQSAFQMVVQRYGELCALVKTVTRRIYGLHVGARGVVTEGPSAALPGPAFSLFNHSSSSPSLEKLTTIKNNRDQLRNAS